MTEFETDLGSHLRLDAHAQDLLFRRAHTANGFADAPVSDEQLKAVYDLVKWAPTAFNGQPLRVVLVRSPEARERLVTLMSPGNQDKTRSAPLVAILAADHDFHDELPKVFPVFPGARDLFVEHEARADTATTNAALQIGYFVIGLRAAGLAAGPMSGFDAAEVSRQFFPDGRHRALVVVTVGQPAETSYRPRQPRLDYDEVVTVA